MNITSTRRLFKKPVCLIATAFLLMFFFGTAIQANAQTKMYVTNYNLNNLPGDDIVSRANLDGTGAENLGNIGGLLILPAGIALDPAAGKMYVVNWGGARVIRANLDGTGGRRPGNLGATLTEPGGIALGAQVDATPVPTLNEWGMIIFFCILGFISIWLIRSRSARPRGTA